MYSFILIHNGQQSRFEWLEFHDELVIGEDGEGVYYEVRIEEIEEVWLVRDNEDHAVEIFD